MSGCFRAICLILIVLSGTQVRGQKADSLKRKLWDTIPKTDTLAPVTVTPTGPIMRLKKDTLEFNTANMRLQANATIEELLKRLPGVQVDQNGVITLNGQRIQRLLVDGEDLFGGDPTVVSRNFNADMIAKVQVFDKKSKRAEFTGVNDGEKTKTLNLTLKEDSKRGYFVKTELGGDASGYYNANGLLGAFQGKKQFAALAMASNTGITGFDGSIGGMGSGLNLGGDAGDAMGASAGPGIPVVKGGGMHYANHWNCDVDHLVGNYSYGRLTTNPFSSSTTEQKLPDSIYLQNQHSSSVNNMDQHSLTADYDWIPDSLSAFKFSAGGMHMAGHNQFTDQGESYFNDTLVNNSQRNIRSDVQNQMFQGTLMYRRSGRKKKERTFSIIAWMNKTENTTKGFLYSRNNFYRPNGSLLKADTTDQRKLITSDVLFLSSSLNYVEPLWKGTVLATSYGISFNRNNSTLAIYNRGDGKYQTYMDSLSNHYRTDAINQNATLNLQSDNKYLSYTIGSDLIYSGYRQLDLLKDSLLRYDYLNINPRANLRYNFNDRRSLAIDYNGSTYQPSITDIQPVRNNNDPLHIFIGNRDLRPGFNHRFGVNFQNVKPLVFNIGLGYGFSTHTFSTRTYTDSLGRQISQVVNTSGSKDALLNFGINKNYPRINLDLGVNGNFFFNRFVNYVNTLLANNDSYTAGGGFNINKSAPDKYSIQLSTNFNYSYSRSSINTNALTHFWTQNHSASISVFPMKEMELKTSCYYSWRQRTGIFDTHNTVALWNASLSRNFLSNRLALRWQINDILGANAGISRNINANQVVESRTNIIGRYWMFSAAYRLMKHGRAN